MPLVKRDWTAADLQALPDDGKRYEVIDGRLFVTPAPTFNHQDAVGRMYAVLSAYLEEHRVGYAYVSPADVTFSPRRSVQPDLFVVPLANGRRPRAFPEVGRLLLAVEVLSRGTARTDRTAKRTLFRDEGVEQYWIIDLDRRAIDQSMPHAALPQILVDSLAWQPPGAAVPLVIDLPHYFARVLDD